RGPVQQSLRAHLGFPAWARIRFPGAALRARSRDYSGHRGLGFDRMIAEQVRNLARRSLAAISPALLQELIRWRSLREHDRRETRKWSERTAIVVACPDNARIPRHPGAGKLSRGFITMFNGIKVVADGYYGRHMTRLLRANLGSHEPQEELVFAEVLKQMRPGARMLECGAYWGFYSVWFLQQVSGGEAW